MKLGNWAKKGLGMVAGLGVGAYVLNQVGVEPFGSQETLVRRLKMPLLKDGEALTVEGKVYLDEKGQEDFKKYLKKTYPDDPFGEGGIYLERDIQILSYLLNGIRSNIAHIQWKPDSEYGNPKMKGTELLPKLEEHLHRVEMTYAVRRAELEFVRALLKDPNAKAEQPPPIPKTTGTPKVSPRGPGDKGVGYGGEGGSGREKKASIPLKSTTKEPQVTTPPAPTKKGEPGANGWDSIFPTPKQQEEDENGWSKIFGK